jgi:DNA-binding PadR family transcriptional regulator
MADNRAEALGTVGGTGELTAAPTNSLVQWALIGLLIERSSYGYELAQRFERTYGGLLRLSGVSYVYTALDALERRALIEEVEVGEDDRRMPRVHYRVTERGVDAYQERLLAQMRENDRRSRLLARQLALLVPEPELALGVLDRYERECLDEAERTPVASPRIASGREGAAQTAERLATEERRLSLDARLAWVEYARRALRSLARSAGPRP